MAQKMDSQVFASLLPLLYGISNNMPFSIGVGAAHSVCLWICAASCRVGPSRPSNAFQRFQLVACVCNLMIVHGSRCGCAAFKNGNHMIKLLQGELIAHHTQVKTYKTLQVYNKNKANRNRKTPFRMNVYGGKWVQGAKKNLKLMHSEASATSVRCFF